MAAGDAEVVARVLGGDVEAYAVLFQKYARVAHAVALARTTRREAAAEVTRKAFEKAYADLERIPPGVRFPQFLLNAVQEIARGYAREPGRGLSLLRPRPGEARGAGPALDLRPVLSPMVGEDAALVVMETVAKLPPNYQVPFLLRYLEGMSYAAIAEATDFPVQEVHTAIDGARRLFEREFRFALEKAAS